MVRPRHDLASAGGASPVARHEDRACRGEDTELFFPASKEVPVEALAICGRCPHTRECLDWALETEQRFGVLGGKTGPERERILKWRGR